MDHSERFTIEDGVLMEYNAPQIVVPEEVREIGDEVFYRSMVSVTLPEGLERIGKWAFRWCGRLRSINIPESVKEIGTGAFEYCSELSTITQPAQDAVLGIDSFLGCTGLIGKDDFLIVGNVLYGYYGFDAHVVVPRGIKKIGASAFNVHYNEFLTSVTLPDGLEEIGWDAFMNCHNLTSVSIPDTVVRIGDSAFCHCTSLSDIKLPEHAEIEDAAFLQCAQFADENGFLIIRDILFEYCGNQSKVIVLDGVTRISRYAFHDNDSLLRVTLPESVESIGHHAFLNCKNLECIDLPKGAISIEKGAFWRCDRLADQIRNMKDDRT